MDAGIGSPDTSPDARHREPSLRKPRELLEQYLSTSAALQTTMTTPHMRRST
jgi:hypothetical protein